MNDLRHRLLASETPPSSRVLFLEALEVYAGGWQIDDSALDYYSNKKSGIAQIRWTCITKTSFDSPFKRLAASLVVKNTAISGLEMDHELPKDRQSRKQMGCSMGQSTIQRRAHFPYQHKILPRYLLPKIWIAQWLQVIKIISFHDMYVLAVLRYFSFICWDYAS